MPRFCSQENCSSIPVTTMTNTVTVRSVARSIIIGATDSALAAACPGFTLRPVTEGLRVRPNFETCGLGRLSAGAMRGRLEHGCQGSGGVRGRQAAGGHDGAA